MPKHFSHILASYFYFQNVIVIKHIKSDYSAKKKKKERVATL